VLLTTRKKKLKEFANFDDLLFRRTLDICFSDLGVDVTGFRLFFSGFTRSSMLDSS
jgi:hypothetical protein